MPSPDLQPTEAEAGGGLGHSVWGDLSNPLRLCSGGVNRFKGLDLIDRVPEELWMEVCNFVQEVVIKTIPKEKKMQKRQNSGMRRSYK